MRGHEVIIKIRSEQRIKPSAVWLNDFPCKTGLVDWQSTIPTVCVAGDAIETLDLRFLVGLHVRIIGSTEQRSRQLFDAVHRVGAEFIACCHIPDEGYYPDTYLAVWSKKEVS